MRFEKEDLKIITKALNSAISLENARHVESHSQQETRDNRIEKYEKLIRKIEPLCSAVDSSIPERYYRGDDHPVVTTVGQLRERLEELPDDLRIESGFRNCAQLIVYNIGRDTEHLEIVEPDEDTDDW